MKVKKLIKELKKEDPEARVVFTSHGIRIVSTKKAHPKKEGP